LSETTSDGAAEIGFESLESVVKTKRVFVIVFTKGAKHAVRKGRGREAASESWIERRLSRL
jgi:hypothetical protein